MKKIEVVCGALIDQDKVMIARRNYGSAAGWFEFPGGKVETNETLEEALKREWKEECQIEIEDIRYLAQSYDVQDDTQIHLTCFTCRSRSRPSQPLVHSEFVWTTPDHIYDYPFFESDRNLVKALQKEWPCLKKPKK